MIGDQNTVFKTYVTGAYFGETEVLGNKTREFTIRAESDCEFLTCHRNVTDMIALH